MSPFIISECGINANGNLSEGYEQIWQSKDAGADAVKFQMYETTKLFKPDFPYFQDSLRGMFPIRDHGLLLKYARNMKIEWFVSPFAVEYIKILENWGVRRYKLASRSVLELNLVKAVGETKKPVIMSNGMATDQQLEQAIKTIGHEKITLLYCVAKYPAKPEDHDLTQVVRLKSLFGFPVGISSHCPDINFLLNAVNDTKASMLEVHTTTSREFPGCDQSSSLEYPELKELVDRLKNGSKLPIGAT